jgi:MFS family permease
MSITSEPRARRRIVPLPRATWLAVPLAALAMVATLPGRTHGLGVVTEPLLADLQFDRVGYAALNLWATLLGALFCVPCGWLLDRAGTRSMLAGLTLSLGVVVIAMSALPPGAAMLWAQLFVLVLLTRGLGQSGLSVASLALLGKAAGRRNGLSVGAYSFLVAVGFSGSFGLIRRVEQEWHVGWRELWGGLGVALIGLAVLFALAVRPAPREEPGDRAASADGMPLLGALKTPAFWVFGLATSFYGLVSSGISLFNQAILAERGFDRQVFLTITAFSPLVGLAANLGGGWLAARWSLRGLLAVALVLLAGALAAFPFVTTLAHVYAYASVLSAAGGFLTVVFFAAWGALFGPAHLGQVQGAAQMLTVLASALGPLLVATSQRLYGSYTPLMQALAAVSILFALASWLVPLPCPSGVTDADCCPSRH